MCALRMIPSLPANWPLCAKRALLHAISLARVALLDLWSGFENGPLVCARKAARMAGIASPRSLHVLGSISRRSSAHQNSVAFWIEILRPFRKVVRMGPCEIGL